MRKSLAKSMEPPKKMKNSSPDFKEDIRNLRNEDR